MKFFGPSPQVIELLNRALVKRGQQPIDPDMGRWGLASIERVEIPLGQKCYYCPRRFNELSFGAVVPHSGGQPDREIAVHRACFMQALGIGEKVPPGIEVGARVEVAHGSTDLRGQRGTVIGPKIIPDWTVWIEPDDPDVWPESDRGVDGFKGVCVEKSRLRKLTLLELIAEAAQ